MIGRRVGRPGLVGTMARTAVIAGTAQAVGGRVAARQNAKAQDAADERAAQQAATAPPPPAAAPPPVAPADSQGDLVAQIERLGALHAQGLLTDAEFAAAKASLLG
jgi:hypothetical protein